MAVELESVLKQLGYDRVNLVFDRNEADAADGSANLNAGDALRKAVDAFLHDEKGTGPGDSPLGAIIAAPDAHGLSANASAAECSAKLDEYLRSDPQAEIALLTPAVLGQEKYRLPPEQGESPDDNWVFRFMLPTKMDILMWGIVDKTGDKPGYCYSVE